MVNRRYDDQEPSIEEMLEDPIVHLLMKRDGLRPGDVRAIWEAAADRLKDPSIETPSKAA